MENSTEERGQSVLIEPENQLPEMTIAELPEQMRAAALRLGWTKLMPVQSRGIPYLMADRDMIVQSHTGSGKTGAFLIPLIMKIDPDLRAPQALVLVPTRELAVQVFREFETLSEGLDIQGVLVYGGVGYQSQLDGFRAGAQVVIGTPGRVLDHLGRRSLSLNRLSTMVFDEADEMLSMGFYPAMRELRGYLPRDRRSWMFSATMPYKVQSLAKEFLREPEFLSLSAGHVSVNTMEHRYYIVPAMEKDLMLMRLIEMENPESAIIFCNMKSEVEYLSAALQNRGYNADQISGDLDQKARERAMTRIRRRETRFLVATDVAARGIDISDLSHVFQHDVPKDVDSYIHRAGRTARAGNTGVVITLCSNMSEKTDLKKIARKYNVDFVQLEIPSEEEVAQRISERVIVLLEEKLRHADRTQKERMKRLEPLVRALADNDDERGLLTLLLDDLYHKTFHAATEVAPEPEPEPRPQPRAAQPQGRGREEDRRRDDDRGRGADRGRAEEPRREEQEAGAPSGIPGAEGEAPRKKKRKRNRGKKRDGARPAEGESRVEGESAGDRDGGRQDRADDRRDEPRRDDDRRGESRREDSRRDDRRGESRRDEPRRDDDRRGESRREDSRRDDDRRPQGGREEEGRAEERRAPERADDRRDRDERGRNERGEREDRRSEKRDEAPAVVPTPAAVETPAETEKPAAPKKRATKPKAAKEEAAAPAAASAGTETKAAGATKKAATKKSGKAVKEPAGTEENGATAEVEKPKRAARKKTTDDGEAEATAEAPKKATKKSSKKG